MSMHMRKFLVREKQIQALGGITELANNKTVKDLVIYQHNFAEFFYYDANLNNPRVTETERKLAFEYHEAFWQPLTKGKSIGPLLCTHNTAPQEVLDASINIYGNDVSECSYATVNPKTPNPWLRLVFMSRQISLRQADIKIYCVFKFTPKEKDFLQKFLDRWAKDFSNCQISDLCFPEPYCAKLTADLSRNTQEIVHLLTFFMEDYSTDICPLESVVIGDAWRPVLYDFIAREDFRMIPQKWIPRIRHDYFGSNYDESS